MKTTQKKRKTKHSDKIKDYDKIGNCEMYTINLNRTIKELAALFRLIGLDRSFTLRPLHPPVG
jgi:hypothetical protein